ncbi:hypothetical protein [Sphingobacterium thalpophilum]|uniref:hypothetical protein n=1 Tax=Sphingobacterium thalpophilum TaxID=259 RepID=UPI003C724258
MKKLMMSLVAVAALTTTAFAGTEAKDTKENANAKTATYDLAKTKAEVKVAEKKESKDMLTKCVYVLHVYNSNGQVVNTYTSETYVENSCTGFFGTCKLMYRHMLANNEL